MNPGYIYILTNRSMPGIVKVGRTARQPETRQKELMTTGVPQPFQLEYSTFVEDCHLVEQQVHAFLELKGMRTSSKREFFQATVEDVIAAINLITKDEAESQPDFSNRHANDLALTVATISIPKATDCPSQIDIEALAERIAKISRRGYPNGLRICAELFETVCPAALQFKKYWIEYLELAQKESMSTSLPAGGKAKRAAVGKNAAEYIIRCEAKKWLLDSDFTVISKFLLSGDEFQYEGYIQHIRRFPLPPSAMAAAEAV